MVNSRSFVVCVLLAACICPHLEALNMHEAKYSGKEPMSAAAERHAFPLNAFMTDPLDEPLFIKEGGQWLEYWLRDENTYTRDNKYAGATIEKNGKTIFNFAFQSKEDGKLKYYDEDELQELAKQDRVARYPAGNALAGVDKCKEAFVQSADQSGSTPGADSSMFEWPLTGEFVVMSNINTLQFHGFNLRTFEVRKKKGKNEWQHGKYEHEGFVEERTQNPTDESDDGREIWYRWERVTWMDDYVVAFKEDTAIDGKEQWDYYRFDVDDSVSLSKGDKIVLSFKDMVWAYGGKNKVVDWTTFLEKYIHNQGVMWRAPGKTLRRVKGILGLGKITVATSIYHQFMVTRIRRPAAVSAAKLLDDEIDYDSYWDSLYDYFVHKWIQ